MKVKKGRKEFINTMSFKSVKDLRLLLLINRIATKNRNPIRHFHYSDSSALRGIKDYTETP